MADYEDLSKNWGSFTNETGVRYSSSIRGRGTVQSPVLADKPDPASVNVYRVFQNGRLISPDGKCLGRRLEDRFDFLTFNEVDAKVNQLSQAMAIKADLKPKDNVGLYSPNCPEWVVLAVAASAGSFVLVPLYDTLGAQACADIINEVEMKIIFVDTYAAAQRILHLAGEGNLPASLKTVVIFFPGDDKKASQPHEINGVKVTTLADFVKLPDNAKPAKLQEPKSDDLYMIQYTSGTTGRPKGVIITHGNMVANIAGVMDMYRVPSGRVSVYTPSILILHYLPLAHSYGQLVLLTGIYVGGGVGFFGGNIAKLLDDAQLLQPTWMPLVPRLMNKFYSKVCSEVERKGGISSRLFWLAYSIKKRWLLQRNIATRSSIWDLLVFRNLQNKLGGKVEFMLTASAPVSAEVLEFWRVVFGATLLEAYGQTEATALVSISYSPEGGNVGHPVSCNMIKLVDVEELGYFSKDGKGEVCVKGHNVMPGYYKQPDKTAEALDAEGWLHTGDIGEINKETGILRLIDRKKHIFKLAQGEYIAPEKIESVYAQVPLVAQVFVDGNGLQWFTVAVVVPDQAEAAQWASKNGITGKDAEYAALCKNEKFTAAVLDAMVTLGKSKGLNQLEQVRAVHLHSDPFTVANDLITPSMKNRRPQLRTHFKTQIDQLYAKAQIEQKQ